MKDLVGLSGPHCPDCGCFLVILGNDGHVSCGGRGDLYGCEKCRSVFRQTSGGVIATPEGEIYKPEPYTLDEYRARNKT